MSWSDLSSFIAPAKRIVACMLRLDKIYETLLSLWSRVRVANVLLSTGVGLGSDGTDNDASFCKEAVTGVKKSFSHLGGRTAGSQKNAWLWF